MDYQYISMDRIFSKLGRDITEKFSEDDIIEWSGEALEFIGAVKAYEEAVAFIEVKNHQCEIPKGLHAIIQVARNNNYQPKTCSPASIIADANACKVQKSPEYDPCYCPSDDAVWLDCNGTPIVEYDLAYYRPYFDLKAEYEGWSNSGYYGATFTPIRLSTNSLFNSLVCEEGRRTGAYQSCKDEYTVVQKSILRFSFSTGHIALAYTRQVKDIETGYPMIPDNISYTTAIVKYINMMITQKEMYSHREGAMSLYKTASEDWQWYCGQASNNDKMIHGLDEHQNFLDQRSYILPRNNSYFSFFGNLNNAENRKWNQRFSNNSNDIFRGRGTRPVGILQDDIIIKETTEDQWDGLTS